MPQRRHFHEPVQAPPPQWRYTGAADLAARCIDDVYTRDRDDIKTKRLLLVENRTRAQRIFVALKAFKCDKWRARWLSIGSCRYDVNTCWRITANERDKVKAEPKLSLSNCPMSIMSRHIYKDRSFASNPARQWICCAGNTRYDAATDKPPSRSESFLMRLRENVE